MTRQRSVEVTHTVHAADGLIAFAVSNTLLQRRCIRAIVLEFVPFPAARGSMKLSSSTLIR